MKMQRVSMNAVTGSRVTKWPRGSPQLFNKTPLVLNYRRPSHCLRNCWKPAAAAAEQKTQDTHTPTSAAEIQILSHDLSFLRHCPRDDRHKTGGSSQRSRSLWLIQTTLSQSYIRWGCMTKWKEKTQATRDEAHSAMFKVSFPFSYLLLFFFF